ncbi:tubulin delta chain-like [Venturia canescens]|uniref:tubulin delta chain-like n=1 Tax=Venturia canescens TaxID=32260 RepID=UPI001C9CF343|nr:tubulin delta chain-like [Venturia canescens]
MLTIQFGQCGNQLGHELFTKIAKDIESKNPGSSYEANYDYCEATCEKWFSGIAKDGNRITRAVLVDTERKVLDKIRDKEQTNCHWRYSRKNEIYQAGGEGSGNNWSYGYFVKAKQLEAEIIEAVRRECERSDHLNGFLGLLGSAGGTGSGVASRVIELLRDEYPTKTTLGILVLPFPNGEVGVQNYNGLLTLGKFVDFADGIILLENDRMLRICTKSANQRIRTETRFLQDINEVACEKILAVFQPTTGVRNEANYFVNRMAAHPAYKISTVKSTPPLKFSTKHAENVVNVCDTEPTSWEAHVKQLKHTLRIIGASHNFEVISDVGNTKIAMKGSATESSHHVYRRAVANMLITRGNSKNKNSSYKNHEDPTVSRAQLMEDTLYTPWSPKHQRLTHLHEKRRFLEREKFVALVTNNSQICETLDGLVEKAWNCYTHAAFLHKYKQYGLEDDDFLRAFAKVENVIKLYGELDRL